MIRLLSTITLLFAMGCAGNGQRTAEGPSHPPMTESGPRRVVLGPGDDIEVKFYYTPELNVRQQVRPDGRISLSLIGEADVMGFTPGNLRDELLELYDPHLRDPDITVIVHGLVNQRVFVGGAVVTAGMIEMPGELTVLEAIAQSGGFDYETGDPEHIIVIRREYSQWYGYEVDLSGTIVGEPGTPVFLQPRDVVWVSHTPISDVNLFIEQHINRIIPRIFYRYNLN